MTIKLLKQETIVIIKATMHANVVTTLGAGIKVLKFYTSQNSVDKFKSLFLTFGS